MRCIIANLTVGWLNCNRQQKAQIRIMDLIHIDKLSGNHNGKITTHVLVGANLPTFTSTTFETTILRAQLLLASNPHTFDYAWEGIRQWATISIWTLSFFCAVAQHRAYGSTCKRMAQPASMKLNLRAYGSTCLYGHFFIVDLLLIL